MSKLREQKEILRPLLEHLCTLVQSDSFNCSLNDLGLLDIPDDFHASAPSDHLNFFKMTRDLNFDQSLCVPPSAEDNDLAKNISRLFESKARADMTIVIVNSDNFPVPEAAGGSLTSGESQFWEVKCHRVVLSARCPYFRRALTSGMREAIER